jgi:hypothetical protein
LLRYFRVKACVVDSVQARRQGFQCDGCNAHPIVGDRFTKRSQRDSYDLCCKCFGKQTVEKQTALTRVPASASPSSSDRNASHARMVDWIWRYFTSDTPLLPPATAATGTAAAAQPPHAWQQQQQGGRLVGGRRAVGRPGGFRPPLFLQHQGHSRTVVGIEQKKVVAGKPPIYNLLIWDPSTSGAGLLRAFKSSDAAGGGGGQAAASGGGGGGGAGALQCSGCGKKARRSISRSQSNPNRPYFACPTAKAQRGPRCDNFFQWDAIGSNIGGGGGRRQGGGGGRGRGGGGGGGAVGKNWEQLVKRGVHTLRQGEFQIVYVAPGLMTAAERDASKRLDVMHMRL